MGELIQFPNSNDKDWDGDPTQSSRWTEKQGIVIENGLEEDYADMWVKVLGMPPRREGELWHKWAERTAKERGVGMYSPVKTNEQEMS